MERLWVVGFLLAGSPFFTTECTRVSRRARSVVFFSRKARKGDECGGDPTQRAQRGLSLCEKLGLALGIALGIALGVVGDVS